MAKAERPGRRRLPLELLVIGAACLVCCAATPTAAGNA
jgi:hypothetical protein